MRMSSQARQAAGLAAGRPAGGAPAAAQLHRIAAERSLNRTRNSIRNLDDFDHDEKALLTIN